MMERTRCIVGVALALVAGPAGAATWTVDPSGAYDYATIQVAIDQAADGDTILINPGTYAEQLNLLNRVLTLEGTSSRDQVVITSPNATGPTLVVVESTSTVTFRRVTLDGSEERRSLVVSWGADLTLDDVAVLGGTNALDGFPGGNIDVFEGGALHAMNVQVAGGAAQTGPFPWGGNIALEQNTTFDTIGDVDVINGIAERGGGLWVGGLASATVTNAWFSGNRAIGNGDNDGGGICAEDQATLSVSGTGFLDNHAGTDDLSAGGGIYAGSGFWPVDTSTFSLGSAHAGGAVAVVGGQLIVADSSLDLNTADKGAAVFCDQAWCGVAGDVMTFNVSTTGGAVASYASDTALLGNQLCNNFAEDATGALVQEDGGAVLQSQGTLRLFNNVFVSNAANRHGGAVWFSDAAVESQNNHYLDNQAITGDGGAIYGIDTQGFFPIASSVNDLYAHNESAVGGAILYGVGLGNSVEYGWFWSNTPGAGTIGGAATSSVDVSDMMLSGWSAGSCSIGTMIPAPGSPLIDAGDPAITDADGSISDIGAFGGQGWDDATDQVDADGDGVIAAFDCDDNDASIGLETRWHPDADGDGWGDLYTFVFDCTAPPGWLADGSDCNDADPLINPQTLWWPDSDGDGLGWSEDPSGGVEGCLQPPGYVLDATDCDDTDPTVLGPEIWYPDGDGDGFGVDANSELFCDPPLGTWSGISGDCNDENAEIHPDQPEICDEIDQDCDGEVDEDPIDGVSGHPDQDRDGWGGFDVVRACDPAKVVDVDGDCNDSDPAIHPEAEDPPYDGIDQNCDGENDFDFDGDGFPEGEDCDDTDPEVNPDATERFDDGIDNDCDGVEARSWVGGGVGCACDAGGSGGTGWAGLVALALVWRRRRP